MSVPRLLPALAAARAQAVQPVVVELFTSQGCSSCPPANAAVSAMADRPRRPDPGGGEGLRSDQFEL